MEKNELMKEIKDSIQKQKDLMRKYITEGKIKEAGNQQIYIDGMRHVFNDVYRFVVGSL